MKKNDWTGILIIVGIIFIGLSAGSGKTGGGLLATQPKSQTPEQKQQDIQRQIQDAQFKTEELKKQVEAEEKKKTQSKYNGIVTLSYINRSTDPKQEFISLRVNNTTETIRMTGWKVESKASGVSFTIPQATYLYFTDSQNTEQDIYAKGGDTLYLITGTSPINQSFKLNKCSGYLTQFQNFTPYLPNNCPLPKDENLSGIPKTSFNDACLDYIESFPSCRIQTTNLPQNWGYECTNFIYTKLNYPSCVNTHKADKDFYANEWRVYLKRSDRLWKNSREEIVLYDNDGKIVSTLSY